MSERCSSSNFQPGERVKFPVKVGFGLGTVVRGLTEEWPAEVIADEPVWHLSEDDIRFWYDGDQQKAGIAARTFYLYKLSGSNLFPL